MWRWDCQLGQIFDTTENPGVFYCFRWAPFLWMLVNNATIVTGVMSRSYTDHPRLYLTVLPTVWPSGWWLTFLKALTQCLGRPKWDSDSVFLNKPDRLKFLNGKYTGYIISLSQGSICIYNVYTMYVHWCYIYIYIHIQCLDNVYSMYCILNV